MCAPDVSTFDRFANPVTELRLAPQAFYREFLTELPIIYIIGTADAVPIIELRLAPQAFYREFLTELPIIYIIIIPACKASRYKYKNLHI